MKLIILLLLISCERNTCILDKLTIVSIGGCSSSGSCGVKLSDGSFDRAYFPIVGQSFNKYGSCKDKK